MSRSQEGVTVDRVYHVRSGDFHAAKDLDPGEIPLISCGDEGNGLIGFFALPQAKVYRKCITVAYNGSWPLTAKFHPYPFAAKDDVAILVPRSPLRTTTLLYTAALLNRMTWRYSYGRKCFREKLSRVVLAMPTVIRDGTTCIDEDTMGTYFPGAYTDYIPPKTSTGVRSIPALTWWSFRITDLLAPQRGDFHSLAHLSTGSHLTVSRVSDNNGVMGYFERPDGASAYSRGHITVSTVGGEAFVQLDDFIATDNVVVCRPRQSMRITTLFFIAFMLNQQKWRYGYGRQCYLAKLERMSVPVPVLEGGEVDEDSIEAIVTQTSYWEHVRRRFVDWTGCTVTCDEHTACDPKPTSGDVVF